MTVTYYSAALADPRGKEYHCSIFWDKSRQRSLTAHVYLRVGPAEVGHPLWSASAANTRTGLDDLVRKMKTSTEKMGLRVVSERETEFSPPE